MACDQVYDTSALNPCDMRFFNWTAKPLYQDWPPLSMREMRPYRESTLLVETKIGVVQVFTVLPAVS